MADRDNELNVLNIKEDSLAAGSVYNMHLRESAEYGSGRRQHHYLHHGHGGRFEHWVDSFRRDPNRTITPKSVLPVERGGQARGGLPMEEVQHGGRQYFDLQGANYATANSGLSRELKGRHLQMIAIGGSIGMCPARKTAQRQKPWMESRQA